MDVRGTTATQCAQQCDSHCVSGWPRCGCSWPLEQAFIAKAALVRSAQAHVTSHRICFLSHPFAFRQHDNLCLFVPAPTDRCNCTPRVSMRCSCLTADGVLCCALAACALYYCFTQMGRRAQGQTGAADASMAIMLAPCGGRFRGRERRCSHAHL
jgi:hypothetical protein